MLLTMIEAFHDLILIYEADIYLGPHFFLSPFFFFAFFFPGFLSCGRKRKWVKFFFLK